MPNKHNSVSLHHLNGVADGTQHHIEPDTLPNRRITIGREDDNVIVIKTDAAISRYHAMLYWQEGAWWLEDNDSKNGTFVEHHSTLQRDVRVRISVQLEPDQLFRVGKTWLRFQVETDHADAF